MSLLTLALDLMGGDHGPSETVPAAAQALSLLPHLKLLVVGDLPSIQPLLLQHSLLNHPRATIIHASQVISMSEQPAFALRHLKDSSMRVALELVQQGRQQEIQGKHYHA